MGGKKDDLVQFSLKLKERLHTDYRDWVLKMSRYLPDGGRMKKMGENWIEQCQMYDLWLSWIIDAYLRQGIT